MRAKNRTPDQILKVCSRCELERPHRLRPDSKKPRQFCTECWSVAMKEWREKNWQREKLRNTWRGMNDRCHNPARMKRWAAAAGIAGAWRDYGAAGVKVCDRWRDPEKGFENFCADVGPPPSKADTLDRINPYGGYAPDNCRWSSKPIQDANRKNAVPLEGRDPETGELVSLTIGEWARRLGITRSCLNMRLRRGWPLEQALTPPDPSVPF